MVGILFIIAYFVIRLYATTKESSDNNYLRSISPNALTYTDAHGVQRLKNGNKPVSNWQNNGHTYLRDKYRNVVADATEANMMAEVAKHPDEFVKYDTKEFHGYTVTRYARLVNNKIKLYTMMHYKDLDCVADLENYRILYPTAKQIGFEKICESRGYLHFTEQGIKDVIDEFNSLDQYERECLIGEGNGELTYGGYWSSSTILRRKPKTHWSYFSQKGIPLKGDKPWIH